MLAILPEWRCFLELIPRQSVGVLATLDRELGRTVFERKHSGARLTEGGKAVLLHVRRALAEMSRSSRRELETALAVLASSASASEFHRPVSPFPAAECRDKSFLHSAIATEGESYCSMPNSTRPVSVGFCPHEWRRLSLDYRTLRGRSTSEHRARRITDLALASAERDERSMTYRHVTAPTQFIEANGIRFANRRFGQEGSTPLLLGGGRMLLNTVMIECERVAG